MCIDRICIIHYHYNDLNLFFPFHLVREEISEIYRSIIFNNIFLNFTKFFPCVPARFATSDETFPLKNRKRKRYTHIKIDVSIIKGGSPTQKEINIILKFLFFLYFPQQYRNRKPIVSNRVVVFGVRVIVNSLE